VASSGHVHKVSLATGLMCFLVTVPFALILNGEQAVFTTQIYSDGTGLRQIRAEAHSYFRDSLDDWTGDVEAGGKWQRRWQRDSTARSTTTISRNFISSQLQPSGSGSHLQIQDVAQNPMSLYTTYTWTEKVEIKHLSAANPEEARAGGHYLLYHAIMPGRISEAAARPSSGPGIPAPSTIMGNGVVLMLDAAHPEHTVTITAHRFRWGPLAIVLYVALFVVYQIGGFALRRARSRPKRI
jgi:hypothetical protein